MSRSAKIIALFALFTILLFAWYSIAANYDDAILGKYYFESAECRSILDLQQDHLFHQQSSCFGKVTNTRGSWYRAGMAGIGFSKEFTKLPGQEITYTGEALGHLNKTFGLLPQIVLDSETTGPVFRKKWLD